MADRVPGVADPADPELIDCRPFLAWPAEFHAYRLVNDPPGGTTELAISLPPAVSRPLVVEYPDGRATYTSILGLQPYSLSHGNRYYAGQSNVALAAGERRRLILSTMDGRYAAAAEIRGDEPGPIVVRLKPTGTVTGRLVDAAGEPVIGASFRLFFDDGPGRPGVFVHNATLIRDMTAADLNRAGRIGPFAQSPASRVTTAEHSGVGGRFTLTGLLPEVAFDLQAVLVTPDAAGRRLISGEVIIARPTVKSGETLDLGDLRGIAPPKGGPGGKK
jgi:hypothetical protein